VSAAPTQKTFTPKVSPSCITPNTATRLSITLLNTMPPGGQSFASANISVPNNFADPTNFSFSFANPSTAKHWHAQYVAPTRIIQLRSDAASDAIPPQGSVTVSFDTTSPTTLGSYEWTTVVKQSNDFRGNNNQFFLTTGATQASTTVGTCNPSPTANAVSKTTDEDTATNITLAGSDAGTCELTFSIVSGPTHGSLGSISNNACASGSPNTDTASVQYTPTADYNGSDSFTYKVNDGTSDSSSATVSITINPIADPPTADAKTATTNEDTAKTISLSGSDPDTCNLTFSIVSGPANGTLGLISDNACTAGSPNADTASVQYTPASDFNGSDSFTYKVNDGTANSSAATVSITVDPANDVPTADAKTPSADEDAAVSVTLTGSDIETCQLTFSIVSGPTNGTLGTISNDACVAGNPNSDSATVLYTPNENYFGSDSFTYKVNDGTADSNTATVSLTVNSVNDAPTAVDDSYSGVTGETVTVTASEGVLANDSDPENSTLTAILDSDVTHGTLTLNADGSFTYAPNGGFSGDDSFTYHASDGTDSSNIATVDLTVWASSLDCGQSMTLGSDGTEATITNLDGEGCEPVVFTATFDGDQFDIQKPDSEHVRLRIDLDAWNPEPAVNPIPATQVSPPVPAEDGVWCNGDPTTFSMPTGETWCLIQQSALLAGNEGGQQMQVNESWLLEGDATLCRTCK
jgi:VCBS repeat-containing protein